MTHGSDQSTFSPGAPLLLDLLEPLTDPALVGFEPSEGFVDLHVSAVPHDPRAGSAGLFGFVAPKSWVAIGAVLGGSAIHDGNPESITDVSVRAVLTRDGGFGSTIEVDGIYLADSRDTTPGRADAAMPQGMAVDVMHRVMGLRCPGEPPPLSMLVLSVWFEDLLRTALDRGSLSWSDAVSLHPASKDVTSVNPSVETLAEMTTRSSDQLDWERIRARAGRRSGAMAELSPSEARWMDATLFGRWVLASLPDVAMATAMLDGIGATEASAGIQAVTEVVSKRCCSTDEPPPLEWSA